MNRSNSCQRSRIHKAFLGGYRNRITRTEYHHAIAQTAPASRPKKLNAQSRETQTIHLKNAWTQDTREATTQMTKIGVYVSTKDDRVMCGRDAPTVDEWLEARLKKIVLIQCCWRRWLAKRRVAELLKKKRELERIEREIQESLVRDKEHLLLHEYMRRSHPRTKSDFDLVYKTIENWRLAQLTRIDEAFDGPERKALLCKLHKDECALLSAVEAQKIAAKDGQDKRARERLLSHMSSPIEFFSTRTGERTFMETPWITRAKELVSLYRALVDKKINLSERLDLLLSVTVTVSEFVCDLTSEISSLIDREVRMLTNGAKMTDHVFDGIRTRLANLFLEFLKNPLFNPQVARFLPAPPGGDSDAHSPDKKMIFCTSCRMYKKAQYFDEKPSNNFGAKTTCFDCNRVTNLATRRADLGFYKKMLQAIRSTESMHGRVVDPVIFLMSDIDLKYLLETIWQMSSAISGRKDLYDLKFVRWDRNLLWSPWNCILLTREEAVVHLKMLNRKVYSDVLTKRIVLKHERAKRLFSKLIKTARESVVSVQKQLCSSPVVCPEAAAAS
ncbi:IQ and ubiquitin-like domain-containing protein [Hypsibius exemplaris]|uniref:IQ and ubiquitin-like domain-containing protein n=1 Tax=Hypsibius exemplaris TaxID=2072580 RepID=A0A1W0WD27_HYPEX|nr:IQ and ubiquitin-like domain-containing protein [Hypsibius exemplaris]